ncbi:MAG: hypothetical protein AMXMBFR59_05610 [Rhodanobacteraceae bacterium]
MSGWRRLLPSWLLLVALATTVSVYWVGLRGPFLFDDFANLPLLGEFGRLESIDRILRYLTAGTADALGRPIALLTFLFDATSWPAEPFAFKRSNLVVHLINGVLLYGLLCRLGGPFSEGQESARLAAVLATAAWLLHPLLVSTTLYVVQREAMLTATFVFIGLTAFVAGRNRFSSGKSRSGLLLMAAGLIGGTILAILCKANGAVLPLLAFVLEKTVLSTLPSPPAAQSARRLRAVLWLLVYLPSLVLILALLVSIPGYAETAETYRSWTLAERVLTQPRMLMRYVQLLFLPRAYSPGLLNDDIAVSTGPLSPESTLPAILAVVLAIVMAVCWRHRWPRLAAAVLFFFAGHVIESTVVPLEMYFEHRNYLPAALLFWPLAVLAAQPVERAFVRLSIAAVVLVGLAVMTKLHADLWSDGRQQAMVWASMMPNSPRAQANAAQFEIHAGRADLAERRLRTALARHPAEPQLAFNLIGARCALGTLDEADVETAALSIRNADRPGELLNRWIDDYFDGNRVCARFSFLHLSRLIDAAESNPRLSPNDIQKQTLMSLAGRMALMEGDAENARAAFDRALDFRPQPAAALRQSALLAGSGFACEALRHLDRFARLEAKVPQAQWGMPMLHERVLRWQNYWPNEFAHLRSTILDDIRAAKGDPASCQPLDESKSS